MTYKELYNEVRHLGFEGDIEPREVFLFAARRALRQLSSDLPEERVAHITLVAPTVRRALADTSLRAGEVFTCDGEGGALSLSLGGRGAYTLTDEAGEQRGFYFGTRPLCLRPTGAWELSVTAYTASRITHARIFEGTYPTDEDVPAPSDEVTVDLTRYIPSLLYPIGLPTLEGRDIAARTVGTSLILSSELEGELTVRYAYAPAPITGDDDGERVDVPTRVEHLLPLLVASYVFLEDESERAQYYMTLYRDGMLRLRTERPSYTAAYTDILGW